MSALRPDAAAAFSSSPPLPEARAQRRWPDLLRAGGAPRDLASV